MLAYIDVIDGIRIPSRDEFEDHEILAGLVTNKRCTLTILIEVISVAYKIKFINPHSKANQPLWDDSLLVWVIVRALY